MCQSPLPALCVVSILGHGILSALFSISKKGGCPDDFERPRLRPTQKRAKRHGGRPSDAEAQSYAVVGGTIPAGFFVSIAKLNHDFSEQDKWKCAHGLTRVVRSDGFLLEI